MTRNERRGRVRPRPPAKPGGWYSDEFLFGATGGFYPLLPRRAGRPQARAEDRETFEDTYPKHSFSELVRLSLVLAEALARVARGRRGAVTKRRAGRGTAAVKR